MESFFKRYRNALVLIAVLLVQVIALAMQVRRPEYGARADGKKVRLVRYWATAATSPFERFFSHSGHGVRGAWTNYLDLRGVRQKNSELEAEIARMRLAEAASAEDARQGKRLQTLLGFRQQYLTRTVAAQVIGTSGVDQSRVVYIDKGADDGLKPDMAVITPDGIVGKVRDVFKRTAQVLLISDQTSGAGVILESTRIRGILRGSAIGRVQIVNLTPDSRIKPGEQVVTSGGDQVYPRGLRVGVIESIAADPEHPPYTAIVIKPAADLTRLEEVLVVTEMQTEQPAANADGSDAGVKKAADLVAEKLPALKAEDKVVGKASTVVMPATVRPTPVLHPDKYTPGSAPPAAQLQPAGKEGPR